MLLAATLALTLGQTCTFDARWRMPVEFPVPLSDGTPWAKLVAADVDPRGPLAHVVLDAEGHAAVRVRANGMEIAFSAPDFPVTAKTPLTFAEVLTTSGATPLRVVRVGEGALDVVPAPRTDVEPAAAWLAAALRCDALALGTLSGPTDRAEPLDRPVPVSATRGGKSRVTVLRRATSTTEQAGQRHARVSFELADGTRIAGWTATTGEGDFGVYVGPRTQCGVQTPQPPGVRRCERALRLSATRDGRTEEIGTLDAGIGFFTGGTENGRVVIEPEQPWLALLDGWSLTVSDADLRACGDRPNGRTLKLPPAHLAR